MGGWSEEDEPVSQAKVNVGWMQEAGWRLERGMRDERRVGKLCRLSYSSTRRIRE